MKIFFVLIIFFLICIVLIRQKQRKDSITKIAGENSKEKSQNAEERKPQYKDKMICGTSCFCKNETLQRICKTEIIYFDDEELDIYKGINANEYTDKQIEDFSEILNTLRIEEIQEWLHSLELRGIQLPTKLKDETFTLIQKI